MTLRSVPAILGALLLAAPLALAAPLPATALPPLDLGVPGSYLTTYATPLVAVVQGGELGFLNLDIFTHNVVAFNAHGDGSQPWCNLFLPGQCPLFWSRIIGFGEQTEVLGLENIEPGKAYTFFCAPHPSMRGTLVALPGVPA